jgi:hypothetical protein
MGNEKNPRPVQAKLGFLTSEAAMGAPAEAEDDLGRSSCPAAGRLIGRPPAPRPRNGRSEGDWLGPRGLGLTR